ncbi:MAG TPA: hypothetical protein EYQ78_08195 [Candidatus Poseidoniales archaeon]|nr:hypothetical protein [Candidatus Poseidoniales archaeon]
MGIKLSTEFIDKWRHIINDVEKTDIPTHLIDKVIIRLFDDDITNNIDKVHIISISQLKDDGITSDEIEGVINETLYELNDFIDSVDFFLDIDAVAQEVQPETDKILNNLSD